MTEMNEHPPKPETPPDAGTSETSRPQDIPMPTCDIDEGGCEGGCE